MDKLISFQSACVGVVLAIFAWKVSLLPCTTLCLSAGIVGGFLYYSKIKHSYWKYKNVSSPPAEFLYGHAKLLHHVGFPTRWQYLDTVYQKYKDEGLVGFYEYFEPSLMVFDPTLVRHILVKDFEHFTDRYPINLGDKKDEIIGDVLSVSSGERWKVLRSIVSPTFTSSKMRSMFSLVSSEVDSLMESYKTIASEGKSVPISTTMANYTLNVITSCAFGLDLNSSGINREEFLSKAKSVFPFVNFKRLSWFQMMPKLFSLTGVRISSPDLDYFVNLAQATIHQRRKSRVIRGDFLDLLIAAWDSQKFNSDSSVTEAVVAAQVVLFLLAGYDTTANTLSFACYLLAKHPQEQEEIRHAVNKIETKNGMMEYDDVMNNKILDSFIHETLRLFPVATFIQRKCTKRYRLPNSSLEIPEGMVTFFPVFSIQRDSRHWENPEVFDFSRFLPENLKNKDTFSFLSFGNGPRNCVGKRFAMMEMKLTVANLLSKFKLTLRSEDESLQFSPSPVLLKPAQDIYVNLEIVN